MPILSLITIKTLKPDVILSKSQIKKLISFKKSYGGIFIYKGSLSEYHAIKLKKFEKFIILDEELGPTTIQFLENAMNSRLWQVQKSILTDFI